MLWGEFMHWFYIVLDSAVVMEMSEVGKERDSSEDNGKLSHLYYQPVTPYYSSHFKFPTNIYTIIDKAKLFFKWTARLYWSDL